MYCGNQVRAVLSQNFFLDENQIGLERFRAGQNLVGIVSFAHDSQIILNGEKFLDPQPENTLPVSHENPYFSL